MAFGMIVAPAEGNAARRRRPERRPAIASSSASASASRERMTSRVAQERGAGVGQADAARVALDEERARLALERGDLLGHGRLGVGERFRCGGEGALLCHGAQHAEAANIEHEAILYLRSPFVICADGTVVTPLNSPVPQLQEPP